MTTITKITLAQAAAMFKPFDMPSAERPMVEVHKATGQVYPRTRRAYESTRNMAAMLGPKMVRRLEAEYTVYELEV